MAATPNNNPGSNPNQLSEKDLKRLIDLLQKIDKLSEVAATNMANQAQSAGNAHQQLNRLEDEWSDITSDISYASKGFKEILEVIKGTNEGINESVKAYNAFSSIAEKLQRYQRDIGEMSERDVVKQKENLEAQKIRLETANDLLEGNKKDIEGENRTLDILREQNKLAQKNYQTLIDSLKQKKETHGLSKSEKNNLEKFTESLKETKSEYTSINNQIKDNNTSLTQIESTLIQNNAALKGFDALVEGVELTLQRITKEVKFKNIDNLDEKLKNIVKETLSTDINLAKLNKSFTTLSSIAEKVQRHQSGISELSEKEVKNSLQKLESERKVLLKSDEILKKEQATLETEKNANNLLVEATKQRIDELKLKESSNNISTQEAAELKNIQDLYQKQVKTSEELNTKLDLNKTTQSKIFDVITNQDGAYNELRSTLNKIAVDSVSKIDEGFKNIINDISTTDKISKSTSKTFETLSSIAQKLQEYQENITDVNEEDVKKLIKKVELEKQNLTNSLRLLDLERQRLETSSTTNKETLKDTETRVNALKNQSTLTEDEKTELNELEIKKANLIEAENSITSKLEANNKLTEKTQEYISGQNEEYNKLINTLNEVNKETKIASISKLDEKLKSIVKETSSTNENLVRMTKSFGSLTSLAQKAQDHQSGISELSEKEIKNALKQSEIEKKNLLKADEKLKKEQVTLETEQSANKLLVEQTEQQIASLNTQKASGQWDDIKEQSLKDLYELQQKQSKTSDELNTKLEVNKLSQDKILDTITNQNGAYNELRSNLNAISKEVKINLINNIDEGFKNIVEEVQSTDDGINKMNKSFSSITTIAQKIQDHQSGINELSEKDAKVLLEKLESERKRLSREHELFKLEEQRLKIEEQSNKTSLDSTKQEIDNLEAKSSLTKDEEDKLKTFKIEYQELLEKQTKITDNLEVNKTAQEKTSEFINKQNKAYNVAVDSLEKIKKEQENIRKSLGLSGVAVDGIGKAFSKLGMGGLSSAMGLDEAKEKMKEVSKEITNGGEKAAGLVGKFKILGAGLSVIGKNIFSYLTDPLTIVTGLVSGIVAGVKGLISLFEQTAKYNADISKTFALSANESQKIGDNLRAAAGSNFFMTNEEARKSFDAMATATGTINSNFSDPKALTAMNDMVTFAGYTVESAGELYKLGQLNNQSVDDTVAGLQGQLKVLQVNNKLRINEKQAVEMVAKASATVRMNLGANPKKLADAAFYATKLGMTLDEISSAAEQTLNFESSIQNQLEYQVLTGKELNIDAYQQAAATGDAAKAAEEMNKLIEEQGPSIQGNVFAQESLAKTLGISREQLMKSIELQKVQKKLGGDTKDIEEAINRKMKDGLSYEEAAAKVSEEGYESMIKQNQSAEMFSRTISEIKEAFTNALANSQGFKDLFSPANIQKYVDIIQNKIIPFAQKAGELAGKILEYLSDPKKLKELEDKFNKFKDTLGEVAKVAGVVAAVIGGMKAAQMVKNLVSGQPGSSSNPLHVVSAGGGAPGGGPGGGGGFANKSLGGKVMGGLAATAKVAGIGLAGYTAFGALTAKKEEDITQEEIASYRAQKPSTYSEEISALEAKGDKRSEDETKKLTELKAKSDEEAKKEIVSSQFKTGSKTGDLMLAGGEAAAALSINTGGAMGAMFGGAKRMLGFGSKEAPIPGGAPSGGAPISGAPAGGTPSGGGMGDGGVGEAKNSKNIVSKLFDGVKEIIESIKGVFKSLLDFVKDIGKQLLKTISELVKGIGSTLSTIVTEVGKVGSNILKTLSDLITNLGPVLTNLVKVIGDVGSQVLTELNKLVEGIGGVLNTGAKVIGEVGNTLATGAMNIFNTLINGLTTASNSLPTILGNLGKAVGSFFSGLSTGLTAFAQAMAAPTILFGMPVGLIVVGMAMGLAKAAQIAAPAIAALGPMFEGLSKVVAAIAPVIEAVGSAISKVIGAIGDAAVNIIKAVADSISQMEKLDPIKLAMVGYGLGQLAIGLLALTGVEVLNGIVKFFGASPVDTLKQLEAIDSTKMSATAVSLKEIAASLQSFGGLNTDPIVNAADALDKFNNQVLKGGLATALNDFLGADPLAIFTQLSTINTSNLDTVSTSVTNVGTSMSNFQNSLDSEKINSISNSMESLGEKLVSFYENDFSDTEVAAQLQELAKIDSSKIVTLAEAITKLSESFNGLNGTLSSMGDIAPVVTVTEEFVKLHKTVTATPLEQAVESVKEGVKNTYEQAKNWVTSLVSDAAVSQKLNTTQTSDNVAESSSSSIASFFQDGSIKVNDGVKIADGVTKFGKGEIQSAIDSKTGQMFTFDKADYLVASTNEPKEVDIMPTPMAQPSSLNIPPVSQTTTSAPPTVVNVDNSDIVEALKSANRPIILQIGKEEIARAMTGPILTEAKNSSIRF